MLARLTDDSSRRSREIAVAFLAALLFFGTDVTELAARVTDLSALRILRGDFPYRDFWTMYAPGSFAVLAAAFAVFGPHLVVSNVLGIVASAGTIATYYGLVRRHVPAGPAALMSVVVAAAFYSTGYSTGFTSFPPAILLILLAASSVSANLGTAGIAWVIRPGLLLGFAALFKHDVAAYAALAVSAGVITGRWWAGRPWAAPVVVLLAPVVCIPAAAAAVLAGLGAGPAAWNDLVRFPLVDFRYVRGEYFPLVPRVYESAVDMIQELVHWSKCNLPSVALLVGLAGWAGRLTDRTPERAGLLVMATVAFVLHWFAAHVQINTNAISLPVWGLLAVAVGWGDRIVLRPRALRGLLIAAMVAWAAIYPARWIYLALTEPKGAYEWVRLPKLEGIRAPAPLAQELRELADAIARAEDSEAPLLLLSQRNDAVIYVDSLPFWLTDRPSATAFHELHPGITDTEAGHRRMLRDLAGGPPPVVVREHRFDDATLDRFEQQVMPHVPIGSPIIDEWVDARYVSARRFGRYDVMRRLDRP